MAKSGCFIWVMLLLFSEQLWAGRCTGSANCKACTSCRYCKHCAYNGGSCGVCEPKGGGGDSSDWLWWIGGTGAVMYALGRVGNKKR